MTSFYQFLIWFFTIVSLVALMYGVLSADITFIGLFICTLIISVIFHRLNEIYSIAQFLKNRTIDKISFTSLLLEKSKRIIAQTKIEKNLFFL